ncbi:unnamed protein product [Didymodactylos carnosus]|uniref:Ig-like domain-containing protein n=1 Tax=Didymodactylos carnosus TaxID=1234261 RepID=A0A813TP13_9BILA|nr:unnamed protein product [Didymodactylos carnosus]CAF0845710.1 unnamed protein product [Didymodactylos carnosus]CAF3597817.1 unnamed protein product [Didymodactylos carnosus]CAF3630978.1 unnamed protein product [Didymodactylos carnosus]
MYYPIFGLVIFIISSRSIDTENPNLTFVYGYLHTNKVYIKHYTSHPKNIQWNIKIPNTEFDAIDRSCRDGNVTKFEPIPYKTRVKYDHSENNPTFSQLTIHYPGYIDILSTFKATDKTNINDTMCYWIIGEPAFWHEERKRGSIGSKYSLSDLLKPRILCDFFSKTENYMIKWYVKNDNTMHNSDIPDLKPLPSHQYIRVITTHRMNDTLLFDRISKEDQIVYFCSVVTNYLLDNVKLNDNDSDVFENAKKNQCPTATCLTFAAVYEYRLRVANIVYQELSSSLLSTAKRISLNPKKKGLKE